ncbi:MAG TPA: hypothetical protein VF765_36700 [Polyangiaceae bacterium]
MHLRLLAGYGVLAVALGVACGGRADLESLVGPVQDAGGARAPAATRLTDAGADSAARSRARGDPPDAGGALDAGQAATTPCRAGCLCFGTDEVGCSDAGCAWNGAQCTNEATAATPVCQGCTEGGGKIIPDRRIGPSLQ